MEKMGNEYHLAIEAAAKSLCESFREKPMGKPECHGNKFHWQDYIPAIVEAVGVYERTKWGLIVERVKINSREYEVEDGKTS